MSFSHILYPSARRKLNQADFPRRIRQRLSVSDEDNYFSPISCRIREFPLDYLGEMNERGFFDQEIDFFEGFLNQTVSRNEKYSKVWSLARKIEELDYRILRDPCWYVDWEKKKQLDFETEDFGLISGYFASQILTPEEFWSPEKFGFDNVGDLWGSLGALIVEIDHKYLKEGFKWKSTSQGREFITEISGSEHCDLRIFRTDVTPHRVLDPLGREVSYRPDFGEGRQIIGAYHSTEPSFFAILRRWADEEEIPVEAFQFPDRFLERFTGKGSHLGNCADAGGNMGHPMMTLLNAGFPMPRLDEGGNQTNRAVPDGLSTTSKGSYLAAIDTGGNLVLGYTETCPEQGKNPYGQAPMKFPQEEVNQLMFGLFEQARRGLGRTSFQELETLLKFTQSQEYKDRLDENRKFVDGLN
jgi:hypothetical protein